uniref:Uncharacterized protein n=1 Tax=Lepeophtheirus salmonis TaxID=72036 RepID=A0A0K2VB65_LEPSM
MLLSALSKNTIFLLVVDKVNIKYIFIREKKSAGCFCASDHSRDVDITQVGVLFDVGTGMTSQLF